MTIMNNSIYYRAGELFIVKYTVPFAKFKIGSNNQASFS